MNLFTQAKKDADQAFMAIKTIVDDYHNAYPELDFYVFSTVTEIPTRFCIVKSKPQLKYELKVHKTDIV